MLKIYGSDLSSPANKVRFVANYLGLEYEYKKVNLTAGEHRSSELLKLNPVGKVPFIDDGGFVLSESGAIIKYFSDKIGSSLYPKELKERALVDQALDFVNLHVNAALQKIVYNRVFAPRRKVAVDVSSLADGLNFLNRFLPIIEAQLTKNPYLVGTTLTLADMTLLAGLDPAEVANIDLNSYSHINQWRMNLRKQDFYTQCYQSYGESLT
jgi:glutathione S-transferase